MARFAGYILTFSLLLNPPLGQEMEESSNTEDDEDDEDNDAGDGLGDLFKGLAKGTSSPKKVEEKAEVIE